jgi:hypothetical protein
MKIEINNLNYKFNDYDSTVVILFCKFKIEGYED